jgi:hypothetical protein
MAMVMPEGWRPAGVLGQLGADGMPPLYCVRHEGRFDATGLPAVRLHQIPDHHARSIQLRLRQSQRRRYPIDKQLDLLLAIRCDFARVSEPRALAVFPLTRFLVPQPDEVTAV